MLPRSDHKCNVGPIRPDTAERRWASALARRGLGHGVVQHERDDRDACGAHAECDADDPFDHRCSDVRQIGLGCGLLQTRLDPRQALARFDREVFELA
jgi:hypothetical protein